MHSRPWPACDAGSRTFQVQRAIDAGDPLLELNKTFATQLHFMAAQMEYDAHYRTQTKYLGHKNLSNGGVISRVCDCQRRFGGNVVKGKAKAREAKGEDGRRCMGWNTDARAT